MFAFGRTTLSHLEKPKGKSRLETFSVVGSMIQGFLIAADLENASGLDEKTLREGIWGIRDWPSLLGTLGTYLKDSSGTAFSPFIDGALLAIPTVNVTDRPDMFVELIESCEAWIQALSERQQSLVLRVAIHKGEYLLESTTREDRDRKENQIIVGSDALHCSRLVRLASGRQVIVSEEYCEGWKRFDSISFDSFVARRRMHPTGKQPLLFWQKPEKPSRIRFVVPEVCLGPQGIPREVSNAERRAELSIRTARRLMAELQNDLAVWLQDYLNHKPGGSPLPTEVSMQSGHEQRSAGAVIVPESRYFGRVSIFRIDPERKDELECWLRLDRDHRINRSNAQDGENPMEETNLMALEYPRATSYPVKPHPVGPVGLAYVNQRWNFLGGLPDWKRGDKERDAYRKVLKKLRLSDSMINDMNNHSRAFLGIPFSESDLEVVSKNQENSRGPSSIAPLGVLCVDWDDPLEFVTDPNVFQGFPYYYSHYLFSLFAACSMRDGS